MSAIGPPDPNLVQIHPLGTSGWAYGWNITFCAFLYFLSWKINLSGVSPINRSRSGPNSVYVDTDRSRDDNVQGILGAIGLFLGKMGGWDESRGAELFCVVIHTTFWQLRNGRFSPNLATKRNSVSRRWIPKDIFENFHFRGHLPENLKSQVSQTGTSLTAGYRSQDALQRDTVYSTL